MNTPATSETFLLFRSGARLLALPTRQARQVLPLGQLSPLPASGGSLLGLMGALGRAVPVVNLAALLGGGPAGQAETPPPSADPQSAGTRLGLLCEDAGEALLLPIDEVIGNVSGDALPPGAPLLQERTLGGHGASLLSLAALVGAIGERLQAV